MKRRRQRGEGALYQRADGLWTARFYYRDELGRRQRATVTRKTMSEAREAMRTLRAKEESGVDPRAARTATLAHLLQRWLEDVAKPTVRPSTLRSYRGIVTHITPLIGSILVADLTASNVVHALAELDRRGVSPRIRALVVFVLRRVLKQAELWKMADRNVAQLVDKPRVKRMEVRVWNPEQVNAFLDAAREDRLFALYQLALGTGMRQGELFALRWSDVDLDAGSISVQHTLEPTARELAEPKSARGRRKIEIPPSLIGGLRGHRAKLLAEGHPHGYVFTDTDGKPLRGSNVYRRSFVPLVALADAIARANGNESGVPLIRFHDLRHTAATLMLAASVHPKIVQERLGHATIAITLDTYSHVIPTMQREAAIAVDHFFR